MRADRRWLPALAAACLLLFLTRLPLAQADRSREVRVHHWARSIQPGEIVRLIVETDSPVAEVHAEAQEKTFAGYATDSPLRWHVLMGLDLAAPVSSRGVKVAGTYQDGRRFETSYRLEIRSKQFPTRHLTVAPKFVNPPKSSLERIRRDSRLTRRIFASVTPDRFWDGPFESPVPGAATSGFGKRSVLNGQPRSPHSGTDFRAGLGTPVKAPNAGKVVLVDDLYYSGNTVILDHGYGLISYFAHLSKTAVEVGQMVEKGQVLGQVGATGRVTGPHLHWSVRLMQARVDSLSLMEVSRGE